MIFIAFLLYDQLFIVFSDFTEIMMTIINTN